MEGERACFHSCKVLDCTAVVVGLARARAIARAQGCAEERETQMEQVVWEHMEAMLLR